MDTPSPPNPTVLRETLLQQGRFKVVIVAEFFETDDAGGGGGAERQEGSERRKGTGK